MSDDMRKMMEDDSAEIPDDAALARVRSLADEQIGLEAVVAQIEKQLKEQKDNLKRVSEIDLPEAMAEIGLTEFTMDDGTKVTVTKGVKASIPKKHLMKALAWLRKNGAGSIIKNELVAKFGMKEGKKADEIAGILDKKKIIHDRRSSVPWNTLTAFVKERMEAGKPVPTDLLGVYEYKATKIVAPKKTK